MSDIIQERIAAVRTKLAEWQVNGLFVTNPTNRRWLSGFTGSAGVLLITDELTLLGTDFRYWEQAKQQAPSFELVKMGRTAELPKDHDVIKRVGAGIVGIEGDTMSINQFKELTEKLEAEEIYLEPLTNPLSNLRHIKTAAELDLIRQAAAITDWAMAQVNEIIRPGMLERDVAWELEKMMRERGAEGLAFEIIVAGGPNAALAHHHPGERPLQTGDSIVIDMGARLNGYHSDLTRSFYLGSQPDPQFWQVYNLVHQAQQHALENMKAGMSGQEIDALAREVIAAAGQGELFGHSLGHGVGLEIHEGPNLSQINEEPLPAGAVVTVEPGVYIPGWGGVRIEDLVVLTAAGPELLSHCPKNPIIEV